MACDFHQADHGRRGKSSTAADMVREEVALHDTFQASLDAGFYSFDDLHKLDCA
jgi:hypothetical protein